MTTTLSISAWLATNPESPAVALHFSSERGLFRGNAKICEVNVARIHPAQDILFPFKLDLILESLKAGEEIHNPPPGILVGEDFYLVDGHHRTAAQIALGYKTIKVRAVEVSPEEWEAEVERQRLKEKG